MEKDVSNAYRPGRETKERLNGRKEEGRDRPIIHDIGVWLVEIVEDPGCGIGVHIAKIIPVVTYVEA